MIKIVKHSAFLLRKKEIWYADRPRLSGFLNTFYMAPLRDKPVIGFVKIPRYTKVIELSSFDDESLLNSFQSRTREHIRHAIREGISFETETLYDNFKPLYDGFTESKKLKKAVVDQGRSDPCIITKAVYNQEILVMHVYFCDKALKRAVIYQSASLFRKEHDSKKRNLIGRANRFLLYKSMLSFLHMGYQTFDLGGYAYGTQNRQLVKVNEFKDSFNGTLVYQNGYYPFWKFLYEKIRNRFHDAKA